VPIPYVVGQFCICFPNLLSTYRSLLVSALPGNAETNDDQHTFVSHKKRVPLDWRLEAIPVTMATDYDLILGDEQERVHRLMMLFRTNFNTLPKEVREDLLAPLSPLLLIGEDAARLFRRTKFPPDLDNRDRITKLDESKSEEIKYEIKLFLEELANEIYAGDPPE